MKQAPDRTRRHECRQCGCRHAQFAYRGVMKWDRFHELCLQCYRSLMDAQKAQRMKGATAWAGGGMRPGDLQPERVTGGAEGAEGERRPPLFGVVST
jgi:hypothetical protein